MLSDEMVREQKHPSVIPLGSKKQTAQVGGHFLPGLVGIQLVLPASCLGRTTLTSLAQLTNFE